MSENLTRLNHENLGFKGPLQKSMQETNPIFLLNRESSSSVFGWQRIYISKIEKLYLWDMEAHCTKFKKKKRMWEKLEPKSIWNIYKAFGCVFPYLYVRQPSYCTVSEWYFEEIKNYKTALSQQLNKQAP